ncbi:MAG: rhomboid family intramembrane serine protease, partial [Sphingomonadales bacterium]|nr:rhomboid family intramembrane serine protease [Sphingomonadales bacterium]
GIGGSVASYWFSPLRTLSVGASGAIFGLMAAWIIIGRRLDRDVTQIIVLLGINVFGVYRYLWRKPKAGSAD